MIASAYVCYHFSTSVTVSSSPVLCPTDNMSKRKIDASKETEEARSGRRAPYRIWHFTIQASLSGLGMDLESFHGFLHDTFTTMVLEKKGSTADVGFDAVLFCGWLRVPLAQPSSSASSSSAPVAVGSVSIYDGFEVEIFVFCAGDGKLRRSIKRRLDQLVQMAGTTMKGDHKPRDRSLVEPWLVETVVSSFKSQIAVGRAHYNQ